MNYAPIGAAFTLITLVTGAVWGKPTWGTWWTWDARLTSELVLFFLYLGVMGLYGAIEDRCNAARAAACLALVGTVNVPIVHFSVHWRSEKARVGKEWVTTCLSWWSLSHTTTKKTTRNYNM